MKNRNLLKIVPLSILLVFSQTTYAIDCLWIGPTSGTANLWNDPSNWDCGQVPTANDNVTLNLVFTGVVRVNVPVTVNNLTFVGSQLIYEGDVNVNTLTINGIMLWRSGSMNLNLTIANSGRLELEPNYPSRRTAYRILTNNGTANLSATDETDNSLSIEGEFINNGTVNIRAYGFFSGKRFTNNTSGIVNFLSPQFTSINLSFNDLSTQGWVNRGTMNIVQNKVFIFSRFNNIGGTLNIATGAALEFFGNTGSFVFTSGQLTGNGTLNVGDGCYLLFQAPVTTSVNFIIKYASIAFNQGATLSGSFTAQSTGTVQALDIYGNITFTSTAVVNFNHLGFINFTGTVTNHGTINWNTGGLTLVSPVNQATGIFNINSTGVLTFLNMRNVGTLNVNTARTFTYAFVLTSTGTANFNQPVVFNQIANLSSIANFYQPPTFNQDLQVGSTLNFNADVTAKSISVFNTGVFNWNTGNISATSINNSGIFRGVHSTVKNLQMSSSSSTYGLITNTGIFRLGNVDITNGNITNNSEFYIDGNLTLNGVSTLTNNSNLRAANANLTAQTFTNNYDLFVNGNLNLIAGTTFTNGTNANIKGAGNLGLMNAQTLNLSGNLRPGTSPGTLSINGNVNLNNITYYCEINGTSNGSFDVVAVSGNVNLSGGTLNVTWGFTPAVGLTYQILTCNALIGQFSTLNIPAISGLNYNVVYNTTSIVIEILSAILPVEIVSFKVQSSGNQALINWQTATENGVKNFDIEKSADGRKFKNCRSQGK